MRVIDNRYKILFLSYTEPLYDEYLVEDLKTNKELTLYVFKVKFFTDDFSAFIKQHFFKLTKLDSSFLEKSFDFRRIRAIDDELAPRSFYYVCETTRSEKDFFQYAQACSFAEKIELFASICRALFFLHLHGLTYSWLPISSIVLLTHNGKIHAKLKNIVMHKFDLSYKASGIYKNIETDKPVVFETEKQKDIYTCALLFFSIFNLYEVTAISEKDVYSFFSTGDFQENDSKSVKLRTSFLKILSLKFDSSFGINDILIELSSIFGDDIPVVLPSLKDELLFPNFISYQYEMQLILSSAFLKDSYITAENVFLVSANDGMGKTRFLREIENRLKVENVLTFSFFDIGIELSELCNEFLEQTHLFTTNKKKNTKTVDLSRYVGDNTKKWAREYFDFFDQCTKNMKSISQHACIALIVDDAHEITEREFLGGLLLAAYELRNFNFMMIIAYDAKDVECENYILERLQLLNKKNFYKRFFLSEMDPTYTKELISQSIHFKEIPAKFFESVFLQSAGNPKKILKLLSNFIKKKKILISEHTGYAEVTSVFSTELKNKKIDFQIINESLHKRISSFSEHHISLIKFLSIFNEPIEETWILHNKSDAERTYLNDIISQLIVTNVISTRKSSGNIRYFILDSIIKDLVLKSMDANEELRLHEIAVKQIESSTKNRLSEELAFHLKKSNSLQRARRCYIKLAIQAKRLKNLEGIRSNILEAINCTNRKNHLFLARLYLDLSIACFEMGDLKYAKIYLNKALKNCKKIENETLELEIYVQFSLLSDILFDYEKIKYYQEKAHEILFPNPTRYPKSYASFLRVEALSLYDNNMQDESLDICNTIIQLAENRPGLLKEKSNTLRIAADLMCRKNKFSEGKKMLEECVAISDKIGHIRGLLFGYMDFAFYYTLQNKRAKAIEYYRKIKVGSIKHKIVSSEIFATDYIANDYFNQKQYQLAFQYALYGFELAKKNRMYECLVRLSLLLIHICFSLNDDTLATKFFAVARKYITKGTLYNYDLNVASVRYYMYFHEYNKAHEYLNKIEPYSILDCGLIIDDMELFIQLLRIEVKKTNIAKDIDKLFEIISRDENYVVLIESSYFAFLSFLRIGNVTAMRRVYDILVNVEKAEISTAERSKIYFVRSFFEPKNAEQLLQEVIRTSFKFGFRILKIYSLFELASIYTERNEDDVAIAYYLEAISLIKMILAKLPSEQRINYFKGKRLFIASENIETLLHNGPKKSIIKYEKTGEHISLSYYNRFYKKDFLKLVNRKANFFPKISSIFLNLQNKNIINSDVIGTLNTEIKNDINTLLMKIVVELLATEAFILMIKNKNDVDIIAHYSYLGLEPNLQLFYKITSSKEPIVLTKSQLSTLGTDYDIHACLSFPIKRNSISHQSHSEVLGYVYVNSTYAINLIQSHGVSILKQYENLFGIFMQSYTFYQIATIDKLTKALTRQTLNARLEEFSNKYELFSVVYYDLDFFKTINDTYGHDVGDIVLSTVAEVVNKQLIDPEFLGRQGGEEFILCLPNVNSQEAFERAETIRKLVEKTTFLGYNFNITISLGIATYGEHSKIVMDVLQKADHAMYYSKQTGKNKVTIWTERLKTSSISINSFSQIASMSNVLNPSIVSYIVEILELSNSSKDALYIVEQYLENAKVFLNAEDAFIIFSDDGKVINEKYLMAKFEHNMPFWFSNVTDFIKEKPTGLKIFSDFPSNESNAIFRNGVSILLIPVICKEAFLGVLCFTTQRYIKEFSFTDAAIQTFAVRLIAHSCMKIFEMYKTEE